ncbi:polysaccharide deacetylase family protein [Haloarcula laminariae]|uniref:polysaccharide deacetylase family protein n=1 Tax=Haloarcula laminariae TaxID=2961577 RepID=UPI0021C9D5A5|nr:polysaccharide deacetylase family protein [Halomicroarcula laminariae]
MSSSVPTRLGRQLLGSVRGTLVRVHGRTGIGAAGGRSRNAILMYHAVDEPADAGYFGNVTAERFRETVRYVTEHAEVVPLSEITTRGARQRVAITFDDALKSVPRSALPILEAFDAPATVFVNPELVGDPDPELVRRRLDIGGEPGQVVVTDSQLRELVDNPLITIGNHTGSHVDLSTVTDEATLQAEIVDAKATLESEYGIEVSAFSYPYGASNERARAVVEDSHDYSVTTAPFLVGPGDGTHGMGRLSAHEPPRRLRWELTPASDLLNRLEYWGAGVG